MKKARKTFLALSYLLHLALEDREYASAYRNEAREMYDNLSQKQKDNLQKDYHIDTKWFNQF